MTLLCLSGWQQPADALANIAPGAVHFDYAQYDKVDAMFAALPRAPELAIGWSLGGQLLARAVSGGYVKPQALILLATPFQWVADDQFSEGISSYVVAQVKADYTANPQAMLKNLHTLIALGDAQEKPIARALNETLSVGKNGMVWLDELTGASCRTLDYSVFPPTTIVHGEEDKVIYPLNAHAFKRQMPQAELLLWPNCAHAPHLHDPQALHELVARYV